ncbi:ferredoxin [Rhodococcoides trifolii]|uniref:Ferredoxin n=1 Tax=Rhodococcoides trifolii TaxID=908250 RepID=A0A917G7H8_9NOCA|nr:2Fe-2S iron-sulfur cluster-binding protein [Rhodococcus trifolii]GGG26920.1 ferredoxin [Rhodococcus trifolii]
MATIRFDHADGRTDTLDVADGTSIMRAAVSGGVDGIVGECGGQAMCATCHVLVHDDYLEHLPPVGEDEDEMLDCTATERDPARSRLGCQIVVGGRLEEIVVDLPDTQV